MEIDLRYLGRSEVSEGGGGLSVRFSPNLARPKVFFDAELARPLRFREAMSALHDVVVGDLKFQRRSDKTAYLEWKEEQAKREVDLHIAVQAKARAELEAEISPTLEADFRRMHKLYWTARVKWANELRRSDPELFRHLVPCDPVVTVAPDGVLFECFSKDESSYGCLTVDRGAFRGAGEAGLGTTNVDYSLALYDHFQTLRTYRPTRLCVDPSGFEVNVEGREEYREEKIDLPPSWLRGFGELSGVMALPCRRVEVPVEAVYSILAFLKRHREKAGPRSLRFLLTPGRPVSIVIDPWGVPIECRGERYEPEIDEPAQPLGSPYRSAPRGGSGSGSGSGSGNGSGSGGGSGNGSGSGSGILSAETEEIKVWGRRRLFALARALPLADRVEVRLLGSGMPSVWVLHMGEMRLVLALSGWTTNDWTSSGASLGMLAGDQQHDPAVVEAVRRYLAGRRLASLDAIATDVGAPRDALLGSLRTLSRQGQVIYDFSSGFYRYREIMPFALADAVLGPEPQEVVEGRLLARISAVKIVRREELLKRRTLVMAEVQSTACEAIFDADAMMSRAKCACSHFFKNGLRAGPCRHLLAVRLHLTAAASPALASSEAPPALPGKAAGKPRRTIEVMLPRAITLEIERAARKRGAAASVVFEEVWDLAFVRIQGCRNRRQADALVHGGVRAVSSKETRSMTFDLPEDILTELERVAARLKVDRAAIVSFAWRIGQGLL